MRTDFLLPALFLSCLSCSSSTSNPAADAGNPQADASPELRIWLSVETLLNDGAIVVDKVSYRSGPYRVYGQVCRPAGAGPYPLFVDNHGGFAGLGGEWLNYGDHTKEGVCRKAARNGYVVIESAYRGEDGSEGPIETCLGEVDDVLAMIDVARAQPYVNPNRVGMAGVSHGGCIALRAMQRGAPVQVAVEFAGPTDWASLYDGWVAALPHATGDTATFYRALMDQVRTSTGGTPQERPEEYRRRSPLTFVADLEKRTDSIVMLQGNADVIVPADQTCRLAAALSGVKDYHLDTQPKETTSKPSACAAAAIGWLAGPRPATTWPDARYLIVYDGVGHGFDASPAGQAAAGDMFGSLGVKFPPK